jgi:hypothetical protein
LPTNDKSGRSEPSDKPSDRSDDGGPPPVSDGVLALFLAGLTVALVLGYLFVNKMADISHQEDCVLAHRRNC